MTETTITLAPLRQHPELAGMDDATLTLFADTLGIDTIRNWDGALATTIAAAWRIREHLDAEHQRQAEADNRRRAEQEAADQIRLGPIRRRAEEAARRAALHAAVDDLPLPGVAFADERVKAWEEKADQYGRSLFEKVTPPAEIDTRTPIERLQAKEN